MKDIMKPIAVLAAICLVVTALLSTIHSITAPIIESAEQKAAQQARLEVMPGAKEFAPVETDLEDVTEMYKADNGGYVIMLKTKGYGGDIRLICGILDGEITKIKTLSHCETSGIGSKVVDNGSGYSQNYVGKTAGDYAEVDSVTGATISSTAYKKAIENAFSAYEKAKEAAKE